MKNFYHSSELAAVSEVGGKGHHLQKLISWGANVAPFFVIGTKVSGSKEILPEIKNHIQKFLEKHPTIVLRSSMVGEDNLDASFAGLFETILGVTAENWEQSLQKIYDSVHSKRVQEYLVQKDIKQELKMAVVVQKEIQVEKSGVLFTRSPMNPTSVIAIDAAKGMGEGVVSGLVDVDHYQYSRLGEVIVSPSEGVLTKEDQLQLLKESLRLEEEFSHPADIEWGIKNSELYIFQIRPITRSFTPLSIYADTNLSESYPGTVSPFSASFVKRAYENVFLEAALILGFTGQRLSTLQHHCSKLISAVDDHLYYHLEHYYAVLRSLPGGEKNIDNWHKMIGGKIDGAEIPYHDTRLSRLDLALSVMNLLKFAKRRKQAYPDFLKDLDGLSTSIKNDFKTLKTPYETIHYLNHLMEKPIGFGLTIINDFFIMIGLGVLSSSLKRKGIEETAIVDLLHTSNSLDSVKPLEAFDDLLKNLSADFLVEFDKFPMSSGFSPYEDVFKTLSTKWPIEVATLKTFLAEYGDRSFEELKLESLPLRNDPELFKQLISWGRNNKTADQKKMKAKNKIKLGYFDTKMVNFTRECIEFRETTRLWRGRFYHFLRMLVIKLAEQLLQNDSRFKQFSLKDFFSVTHHEWMSFSQNKLTVDEIIVMMKSRAWQNKNQQYPEFICWAQDEKLPAPNLSTHDEKSLTGQGVSPGIIEADALVLESPTEILGQELGEFILVTKNTDPAWVYIMSRSKGLISEKGSMLSHTAIIGRELGIPTLVGVKGATQNIKTGDRIRIDGSTGKVEKI